MSSRRERSRQMTLALKHAEADSGAAVLVLIGLVGLVVLYTLMEGVDWNSPLNFIWLILGRV